MTVWYAGLGGIQTCIPDGHLHRLTYTRCRIDTNNSPDECSKHVEIWNKHIRKKKRIVRQVGHLQECPSLRYIYSVFTLK